MKKIILFSLLSGITMLLSAQTFVNVCAGDTVFMHTNSPAGSAIQWQSSPAGMNYTDIAGATNDTLVITNIQNSGYYRTRITGPTCNPYYSDIKAITVNPKPTIYNNMLTVYCSNAPPDSIFPFPAGGTLSGPGITGNLFHPSVAGIGTHIITYTYTSPMGCTTTDTTVVTVMAGPALSFSGLLNNYCINVSPITLIGSPTGGTFFGNGMTGSLFTPSVAGAGTHSITYSYFDTVSNCPGISTQSVIISSLPTTANAGPDITATSANVTLAANTPTAGTGVWAIISGTGGSLASSTNPQTTLSGLNSQVYVLTWTISSPPCPASVDTVVVTMPTGPTLPMVTCNGAPLYVHPTDNGSAAWGCSSMASGATDQWNGATNTALIVQACTTTTPSAALICDTLTAFGFSDWYLPAYNELECLRTNAATIGGFTQPTYWSSSEGTGILYLNAYYRTFPSGSSGAGSKSGVRGVRCVRK